MRTVVSIVFATTVLLACTKKAAPESTINQQKASESAVVEATTTGSEEGSGELKSFTGLYRMLEGKLEFRPCDRANDTYWVLGNTDELNELYEGATAQGYPGQYVVAELVGALRKQEPSRGAAMASPYTAQLAVDRVVKVRAKNARNACLPYDYWATGNEPFWSLQISEAEGVMELSQLGEPTVRFDFTKPTLEQDGKLWRYYSAGTSQRIKVRITVEPCEDTMSGNVSTHTVEVEYAGKTLSGCAKAGS